MKKTLLDKTYDAKLLYSVGTDGEYDMNIKYPSIVYCGELDTKITDENKNKIAFSIRNADYLDQSYFDGKEKIRFTAKLNIKISDLTGHSQESVTNICQDFLLSLEYGFQQRNNKNSIERHDKLEKDYRLRMKYFPADKIKIRSLQPFRTRNKNIIFEKLENNLTYKDLSEKYDLSRNRCFQIVKKYLCWKII